MRDLGLRPLDASPETFSVSASLLVEPVAAGVPHGRALSEANDVRRGAPAAAARG